MKAFWRVLLLIWLLPVWNPQLQAAAAPVCGPIPIDHVIYAGDKLKMEAGTTVNGIAVGSGDTGTGSTLEPDGARSTATETLPPIDPTPFPGNSSNVDADETDSPFVTTTEVFYDKIEIDKNETAAFSGGGIFHIDELKIKEGATVTLQPGEYFINKLDMEKDSSLLALNAIVRVHIGDKVDGSERVTIGGADVSDLQLLLHDDAELDTKKEFEFSGLIYGPDAKKVKMEKDTIFRGLLVTGGEVDLKKDIQFTLTPQDQAELNGASSCPPPPDPEDFLIDHDGSGINCLAEPVEVTARDADGNALETFDGEVTLDTGNGFGSWSLVSGAGVFSAVANTGLATYTYDVADLGVASFQLDYQQGPDVVQVEVFMTRNTTVTDDGSQGDLVFAPSGFTLTSSALSNPPPATINDPLLTQTAGMATAFDLHLAAYGQTPADSTCGVIENYDGNRPLRFWVDYVDPGTGTRTPVVAGTSAGTDASTGSQTVAFTAGQASVQVWYKDVGEIRLQVLDDSSYSTTIGGTSNAFVVRPDALVLAAIEDGSGTPNPAASTVDGTPFVAAGDTFEVELEMLDSDGDPVANFGNESSAEELLLVSSQLRLPAVGGRNGSLAGALTGGQAFAETSTGVFRAAVSFDEVGVIRVQASIADGSYLGTGPLVSSESGDVGRFYPARIRLVAGNSSPACNGFTWMDEPALALSFTLRAETLAGNTTRNWDQTLLGTAGTGTVAVVVEDNNSGINLGSRLSGVAASWAVGEAVLATSVATFARLTTPDGPLESLQPGVGLAGVPAPTVLDGVDLNADTADNCLVSSTCTAVGLGAASAMLYGRLQLLPAFGPETMALDLGLEAQSWDGSRFVRETRDICTGYQGSQAVLSGHTGNLDPGETLVAGPAGATNLVAGAADAADPLRLSAPGSNNTGTVDVQLTVPSHLQFKWDGVSDSNPSASATFGIHRGHDRIIHWRENR